MKLSDLPPALQKTARDQIIRQPRRRKSEAEKALARAEATRAREKFFAALRYAGVPIPEYEHYFTDRRRFRWDYCWVRERLALEVDGGIYSGGKHGRGAGIEKDHEKQNLGAALGWRVMRTTPRKLAKPTTIAFILQALEWEP